MSPAFSLSVQFSHTFFSPEISLPLFSFPTDSVPPSQALSPAPTPPRFSCNSYLTPQTFGSKLPHFLFFSDLWMYWHHLYSKYSGKEAPEFLTWTGISGWTGDLLLCPLSHARLALMNFQLAPILTLAFQNDLSLAPLGSSGAPWLLEIFDDIPMAWKACSLLWKSSQAPELGSL